MYDFLLRRGRGGGLKIRKIVLRIMWMFPNCEICKCKNGGTCDKNKCRCTKKFEGKLCEMPNCVNGRITAQNSAFLSKTYKCNCWDNFGGSNCENGGTCEGEGCKCTGNWEGKLCEKRKCINSGILLEIGKCQCTEVYEGEFCETCKCQNGGTCLDSKCQCPSIHEGNLCQYKKCKNGEKTKESGQCKCPKIFNGELCENCLCQNGECSNNKCNCPENFEGDLCEIQKEEFDVDPSQGIMQQRRYFK